MKKIIIYSLVIIILNLVFINPKFLNSKEIFNDIMILGLWDGKLWKNQYEIGEQKTVEIDTEIV